MPSVDATPFVEKSANARQTGFQRLDLGGPRSGSERRMQVLEPREIASDDDQVHPPIVNEIEVFDRPVRAIDPEREGEPGPSWPHRSDATREWSPSAMVRPAGGEDSRGVLRSPSVPTP